MRCSSIQEIDAPSSVVWKLLTEFERYPRFIKGISACKPYHSRRTLTGGKLVDARYEVKVGTFKVCYSLEHQYEPLKNCMVWHLDYSRKSDVFDSVGYWYVEPLGPEQSRVYYTTNSLLPAWIPAPLRKTFTKIAMKAATQQLEPACQLEMARGATKWPKWLPAMPAMPQRPKQMALVPALRMRSSTPLRSRKALG